MKKPLDAVTGIAIGVLLLVAFVFISVIFLEGFTADQKTMVITATVAALGTVGGYFFNSSADVAKKNEPPPAPSTTTTIVETAVPPEEKKT